MQHPVFTPPEPPIVTIEPLDMLPFVGRTNDNLRRDFWQVRPTGNYGDEYRLGANYASEFVHYLLRHRHQYILGWIVRDMIRHNNPTGLELGFMGYLSGVMLECVGRS